MIDLDAAFQQLSEILILSKELAKK